MSAVKVTKAEKKQTTPLWSLLDGYRQIIISNTKADSTQRANHSSKWLNIPTKIRIKPLPCGLAILPVYDNGSVLSPELLDLTKDNLADKFADGVSMVASLSFTLSYPTLVAALHMFVNAYKNVLVVVVISVVSIENATVLAFEEKGKKDEPVGESDDDLGFSLFD
ncbi:60S acidic ribosomal protein P0-like [Asparagus officinalis]|uniref:60S acidic ribosomal protein P0-like n=1 Tax=Asparagus officinalis TaxID=4686 RepID=UPI00098DFF82|nr:60S acidic ribosomal protein P0-like [Asparagus officinalis]